MFKFSFELVSFVNFSQVAFSLYLSVIFSLLSVIMFSSVKFEKQKQSCLTFRRNYSLNLLYFLIFFVVSFVLWSCHSFSLLSGSLIFCLLCFFPLENIWIQILVMNLNVFLYLCIFFRKIFLLLIIFIPHSFLTYNMFSFSIFSFKKINKFFNYFGHVFLWIFAICWLILNMGRGSSGIGGFEQNHQILFTQNVMIY